MEKGTVILLVGLAGAGGFALAYSQQNHSSPTTTQPAQPAQQEDMEPQDMQQQELPPNHPPINGNTPMGNAMGMGGGGGGGDDEAASIAWKAPDAWKSVPNPNGMRLATYQLSPNGDTELVVSRAGGDVAGNIARWEGQFEGSPKATQTQKSVKDMQITEVQIDGAYTNTMDPSGGAKKDFTMLAAIVQGKGRPYFFKIVGPSGTVKSAKKPFDTMLDGLTAK
jgi:hypothetical protein